jgi:hypothetical protein
MAATRPQHKASEPVVVVQVRLVVRVASAITSASGSDHTRRRTWSTEPRSTDRQSSRPAALVHPDAREARAEAARQGHVCLSRLRRNQQGPPMPTSPTLRFAPSRTAKYVGDTGIEPVTSCVLPRSDPVCDLHRSLYRLLTVLVLVGVWGCWRRLVARSSPRRGLVASGVRWVAVLGRASRSRPGPGAEPRPPEAVSPL